MYYVYDILPHTCNNMHKVYDTINKSIKNNEVVKKK